MNDWGAKTIIAFEDTPAMTWCGSPRARSTSMPRCRRRWSSTAAPPRSAARRPTAPQVTDHSLELGGLQPNTTYNFRVRSADSAGNTASSPAGRPATFSTAPGALVDSRTAEFAAGGQSATLAGDSLDALDGEVQLQPTVAENFDGTSLSAPWTMRAFDAGGSVVLGGGVLLADDAVAHTTGFYDPPRVIEFSAAFRPVNDQAVGFGTDLTQAPFAAFSTGVDGDPFQLYASSVAGGGLPEIDTPLPGVTLGAAHRFRIEWTPTRVDFFVDGVNVATHNHSETLDGPLRPAISDFGLFGASTKVHWLRMGGYGTTGLFTSRVLDSGPGARTWTTLTAASTVPTGTGITYETRSGAAATPGTTWSGWQAVGTGGAIASPAARFIQYRARLTSSSGRVTPTLQRVQIGYGAGTDRPPVGGTVSIAPAAPRTNQVVTATPSGFSDPDGDPLTYHYRWFRNGQEIAGATSNSLNLASAGNGDRGDTVRAEVYASDGRGAASDPVAQSVTVANTAPTAGTASVRPTSPSTNDVVEGRRQRLRGHRQRHAYLPLPVVPKRDGDQRRDLAHARPLAARQRRSGRRDRGRYLGGRPGRRHEPGRARQQDHQRHQLDTRRGHGRAFARRAEDGRHGHSDAERIPRPGRESHHLPVPLVPQRHGHQRCDDVDPQPGPGGQRRPGRRHPRRRDSEGHQRRDERRGERQRHRGQLGPGERDGEGQAGSSVERRHRGGHRHRLQRCRWRRADLPLPVVPQRQRHRRRQRQDAGSLAARQRRPR